MKRTAESYLRGTETVLNEELYPYAEWEDEQLLRALGHEYTVRDSMPHAPERLAQIERGIAHLVFEIEYRSGVYGGRNE